MCYTFVSYGVNTREDIRMQSISAIQQEIKAIGLTAPVEPYSQAIEEYFAHYGLNIEKHHPGTDHIFGTFESNGYTLAGHIFRPKQYKATVILIHGYFNHTGQLIHLITHLVSRGFAVAAFDLPGHGLSTGQRAEIDDFSQYTNTLCDFTNLVKQKLNGPYHLIGFSNGASIVLDYLFFSDDDSFDKVILAAPLVRCTGWEQMKISYKVYTRLGNETVPRVPRKNSSDPDYIDFNRNKDTLRVQDVSLKWVKALEKWNEKINTAGPCKKKILVIQGTSDSTVAWKYNIKFIKTKFTDANIKLIKKARHELFNESTELRNEIFLQIQNCLL